MGFPSVCDSFVIFLTTDKYLSQTVKKLCEKGACEGRFKDFPLSLMTQQPYLSEEQNSRISDEETKMMYSMAPMGFINNIGPMGMVVIAVVVLVLFGRGKISNLMGEVGKGITAFKRGVDDGKKEVEDSLAEARDVTPEDDKDKA